MLKLILLVIFTCLIFRASCTETYTYAESQSNSQSQSYSESKSYAESNSYTNVYNVGPNHKSDENSDDDCENKCTKPHEVYEICPPKCPFRTCGIDDTLIDCAPSPQPGDPDCPEPACRCENQFFRDDKGNCVRWDQCPKCTNPNEEYDPCDAPCPARRCDFDPTVVRCAAPPQVGDDNCVVGCRCIDGYLKDNNGVCVPKDQCPSSPKCPVNEELSTCVQALCRAQNCTDKDKPIACPIILEGSCITGCVCKENFLRAQNGTCIPEDQCENLVCTKPHEVLDKCIQAGCGPRNCTQLGKPIACPRINPDFCKAGCVCEDGYVWDEAGRCIKKTKCPSCGDDPNAKSGCSMICSKRCSNYNSSKPIDCPSDICEINGCVCRKNYVYDDNIGKCVHPKQCTPVCKEHEVYDECINGGCDARNCTQLGYPVPCVKLDPASCIKGCVCENDYLRAENGTCIPKKQCPSCGGDPNAESGCGINCGKRCSTYKNKTAICPRICKLNGCDCKSGYVYDDNIKKCVKPEECTPVCKEHEVYDECINGGCDARNCTQFGYPVPCVKLDPASCIKGCVCENDYLRAKNGTCIPKKQCPSCGGDPNAESGCGTNCGKRCSTYKDKSAVCPLICQLNGCDCKSGYVYDDNIKKCVKPEECTPVCKEHEVYDECINGGCDARNCTQLGYPVPCVKLDPASCIKGCVCENDYLRAKNGTCIPKKQCPSCGGDPNAESGCGTNCGKRCSTYKDKSAVCPLICQLNGCDCKSGYVYDDNIKKCVKPEECTPVCKEHEVYDECINGGCDARNCTQLGYPVPCVKLDPASCIKGCVCENDYLRAKNGTCIPKKQCPSCGGDPNAESGCGTNCGKRCSTYKDETAVCPLICQLNGCDCKSGYVYDDNIKKCVKPEECTPVCKE